MAHTEKTKKLVEGLLRENGATLSSVSEQSGIPYGTVHAWSKKWGIEVVDESNRFSDEARRKIYSDWKSGMDQKEVAEKYGVQRNTVMRIRAEFGEDIGVKYGEDHHNWRGGIVEYTGGYLAEKIKPDDPMMPMAKSDRYVFQHRLVMARSLGRPLDPSETVHHINGDKKDNRLENLQLRKGNHGKGAKYVCSDCGSHNVVSSAV